MDEKAAIKTSLPIVADEGQAWDSGAAIKRVKDWASDSDGNIDFGKYKKAFFWVDPESTDKQGGYKLPFADIVDSELKAVWRGVAAAMAALLGSRGGVAIPDGDRQGVYNAISTYYKKFSKDVPEFKSLVVETETPPESDLEPEPEVEPAPVPVSEPEKEKLTVRAKYDVKTKLAIASTDVEDRHGERVDQNGWTLKNFKNNPVLLWAHDHTEISVGNARNVHIERANGTPRLVFTPDFHTATDKARALKTLYDEGRMNSFSVGFMPIEMDGATNTYKKQELLEISAVNVPANPEAMMLAYKALTAAGIQEKTIAQLGIEKGAIADQLTAEQTQEQKMMLTEDIWEIMYAFCDVWYNEETALGDFDKLLGETIGLLQQVLDGTYQDADDSDQAEMAIFSAITNELDEAAVNRFIENYFKSKTPELVDTESESTNSEVKEGSDNPSAKAQDTPSAAPSVPSITTVRAEQSLVKVIAKASDKLLVGEKQGIEQNERVNYQKIIKRAAEILSRSNRSK